MVRSALTAGDAPTSPLNMGECARINTGAALPAGADCVVEDTKLIKATDDGSTELEVEILVPPSPEQDVALLSTGNELQEPSEHRLRHSARLALGAGSGDILRVGARRHPGVHRRSVHGRERSPQTCALEGTFIDCGIARDSPSELVAGISSALARADILVCTGGVLRHSARLGLGAGSGDILRVGARRHPGVHRRSVHGRERSPQTCALEGTFIDCGIARDSPSELVAGISSALARADILCSSRLLSACGASVLLELPAGTQAVPRLPAGTVVSALVTGRLDLIS
ncbi:Gephyrin [Operophtera brumata]|uniref:Gephyrin n=1 Tax=Operophtera brumata TaxID=104452 RepID=A0A0L7LT69_OPEBR|nr:Gephyrin [Operophtera brumata]